jgi:hypothetical protein
MVLRPDFTGENFSLECGLIKLADYLPGARDVDNHQGWTIRNRSKLIEYFPICRSRVADNISRAELGSATKSTIGNPNPKIANAPLAQLAEQVTLNCLMTICVVFHDVARRAFQSDPHTIGSAPRIADLHSFAAKNLRAVENDREQGTPSRPGGKEGRQAPRSGKRGGR